MCRQNRSLQHLFHAAIYGSEANFSLLVTIIHSGCVVIIHTKHFIDIFPKRNRKIYSFIHYGQIKKKVLNQYLNPKTCRLTFKNGAIHLHAN